MGGNRTTPTSTTIGLSLAIMVSALSIPVRPVAAQDEAPPPGTTTIWEDPTLIVTAATAGTLELTETPGAPSTGPVHHCAWFALRITSTTVIAVQIAAPTVGETYLFHCWLSDPWTDHHPAYPIVTVYDPAVDPPGPLVTTPVAARHALASIEFERPGIVTSPAATQVVGIPTWFAVDSRLDYSPASAQAGPVWATVRPVFRDVTFDLGDGNTLTCAADATTEWDGEGPPTQSSRCRHTYETVGEGATPVSATVDWTVWQRTDRTAGAWEVWGTVSLTTTVDRTVVDLQAAIN